MGKIISGKKFLPFDNPIWETRICPRITVSVFICTFKLTALLLKSFHLLLHCYTLACVSALKITKILAVGSTEFESKAWL